MVVRTYEEVNRMLKFPNGVMLDEFLVINSSLKFSFPDRSGNLLNSSVPTTTALTQALYLA